MKSIYIVNSCDQWKSHSSMSLVTASTSITKIKRIILRMITDEEMEYDGATTAEQIKNFQADWKAEGPDFVFSKLQYGFVEELKDGEIV